MTRLVYFENWVDPVAETILALRPGITAHRLRYGAPLAETWALMKEAHGYQISPRGELREPWFADATLLKECPSLLAISSTGAGFDMVDVDACTAAGVIVCNQSGSNHEAVAEHALGMMLGLAKNIARSQRLMQRQGRELKRWELFGSELKGKVVGIVGIGTIGTRTAALCRALGMEVVACDPYLTEGEVAERGATKVQLCEVLRRSDFISVHCPLTRETVNLFGRAEFEAMRPGAYFINTARGGTYDEQALLAAVTQGRIAGAGVDVFLEEPPGSDHPLLNHDGIIATPHIAGMTRESMHDMARFAAEQWLAIFDGALPPRIVNPNAWPRYCDRAERILGFQPHGHPAIPPPHEGIRP